MTYSGIPSFQLKSFNRRCSLLLQDHGIDCRPAFHKNCFYLKLVKVDLKFFNIIPVDLKSIMSMIGVVINYVVIIFQFRIMNDDRFLTQGDGGQCGGHGNRSATRC